MSQVLILSVTDQDYHFLHTKRRFMERFGYDLSLPLYRQLCLDCYRGFQGKRATQKEKHKLLSKVMDRFNNGNQVHSILVPGQARKVYCIFSPRKSQIVTVLDPNQLIHKVSVNNIICRGQLPSLAMIKKYQA